MQRVNDDEDELESVGDVGGGGSGDVAVDGDRGVKVDEVGKP
jgi:hypothetical protein